MNRTQNHVADNGNIQRRPPPYARSSLRQHIQQHWLSTFLGVVGLGAGIFLIVANEARAVQISKSLAESISLVESINPDDPVDKTNIGKLIYLTGVMTIHEPLTEVDHGISVLAVKLLRQVQMYQWVESQYDTVDDEGYTVSSNYDYHKEWQTNLINSRFFYNSRDHENPSEFPIKRQTQINENVKIGNYHLGLDLKKKFKDFVPITSDERPERQDIKLHAGMYYHCQDIWKPQIGDVRLQFFYGGQHGQVITVVAELDETLTLVPYSIKKGLDISFLRLGTYSLEEMFAFVHSQNKFQTWVLRGAGWLLLYVSCVSLSTLLEIVVSHSRFLQEVLPNSFSSMKMTVSMCLSLFVTAIAWMWYRPVLGVGLIVVTIPLLGFTKWFSNERSHRQYNRL
ncbi:hypothetical protein RUM43_003442 [Polyplax serrata]|uniref:Transmembrane protein 43 n=1 Tax=Polyplax serrata TaxID=468196 RepID=A0AAN8NWQ1_POLSC